MHFLLVLCFLSKNGFTTPWNSLVRFYLRLCNIRTSLHRNVSCIIDIFWRNLSLIGGFPQEGLNNAEVWYCLFLARTSCSTFRRNLGDLKRHDGHVTSLQYINSYGGSWPMIKGITYGRFNLICCHYAEQYLEAERLPTLHIFDIIQRKGLAWTYSQWDKSLHILRLPPLVSSINKVKVNALYQYCNAAICGISSVCQNNAIS